MTMMKLVMEAVMLLTIVCGMVFISKISSSENTAVRQIEDDEHDSEPKEADNT
jgi:hypothetical protein